LEHYSNSDEFAFANSKLASNYNIKIL